MNRFSLFWRRNSPKLKLIGGIVLLVLAVLLAKGVYQMSTAEAPTPLSYKLALSTREKVVLDANKISANEEVMPVRFQVPYESLGSERYRDFHGIIAYDGEYGFNYYLSNGRGVYLESSTPFLGFPSFAFEGSPTFANGIVTFYPERAIWFIGLIALIALCLGGSSLYILLQLTNRSRYATA